MGFSDRGETPLTKNSINIIKLFNMKRSYNTDSEEYELAEEFKLDEQEFDYTYEDPEDE